MPKFNTFLYVIAILILSCNSHDKIDAKFIINKSIKVSGGHVIDYSNITFNFRDKHYFAKRNKGSFLYGRLSSDSISDILKNDGFERFINNKKVIVPDSMAIKYSSSINSVHYFSVLPYGLNDKAVNKKLLGNVKIKGQNYYKIEVSFNEKGGGEDFEDVFIYFIGKNDFKIKYLAYSYNEDDGLGYRFREAYNERIIEGIRFVDYNNYKPKNNNIDLHEIDILFEMGDLELLSKIELVNIEVSPCN